METICDGTVVKITSHLPVFDRPIFAQFNSEKSVFTFKITEPTPSVGDMFITFDRERQTATFEEVLGIDADFNIRFKDRTESPHVWIRRVVLKSHLERDHV